MCAESGKMVEVSFLGAVIQYFPRQFSGLLGQLASFSDLRYRDVETPLPKETLAAKYFFYSYNTVSLVSLYRLVWFSVSRTRRHASIKTRGRTQVI